MSWNIKSIGTQENVRAEVVANESIPQTVKDAITETIDGVTLPYGDSISVESFGHTGGGYSNIGKLEVQHFMAAKAPAPVVQSTDTARDLPLNGGVIDPAINP